MEVNRKLIETNRKVINDSSFYLGKINCNNNHFLVKLSQLNQPSWMD